MTSKLHQRWPSVVAVLGIVVLLAVIIVVWVQVSHGAFRTKYNITTKDVVDQLEEEKAEMVAPDSNRLQQTQAESKQFIERTYLQDHSENANTEFVKPLKISPLPLHDHDILYEQLYQQRNHTTPQERPSIRHHSGHFRHKMAEIWDPHPEYEITAFGHKLHLVLAVNEKFVSPKLQVHHMWKNFTRRIKTHPRTASCYYTGKVMGETHSDVTVSLCNGMTGYIHSEQGNFHIEPVETFQVNSVSSILHRIQKMNGIGHSHADHNEVDGENHVGGNVCDSLNPNSASLPSQDDADFGNNSNDEESFVEWMPSSNETGEDADTSSNSSGHSQRSSRVKRNIHSSWRYKTSYHNQRDKRTGNHEYFIETLVVADKTMASYHKTEEELIHYILTLMSHVASLYKDATIGNPISLAVVRIAVLSDVEFVGNTSEDMLREFCKWQQRHNFDVHSPAHHDTALLLTRQSICRNSTTINCNTLGVAEVGTMCNRNFSCAIARESGLSTSYTIAHELGHVLGMPHDDDYKCKLIHHSLGLGRRGGGNIMSKMLENGTKPWMWSNCSKHSLTDFLETKQSSCLLNEPRADYISPHFATRLPGETFLVNKQCELEYGNGSTVCKSMGKCNILWCNHGGDLGDSSCTTRYVPWAEGTPCDDEDDDDDTGNGKGNKWCYHGNCVALNRDILTPVAGGWGEFGPWSECTRTCGGGIKKADRFCDNPEPANGGPYCTGKKVRYASCNTQPCENTRDFREEQCAKFNGNPQNIVGLTKDVMWVPKYGFSSDELCKLYCRVDNSREYYKLSEKVIDGTKCGLHSFNICVNGKCQPAGCDNRLDSNATLDDCGVCGGNNNQCEEISGTYNFTIYGYNSVVKFPKGSSNIEVRQTGYMHTNNDDTYLALVNATGHYILNGGSVVSTFPKDLVYGGVTIRYSGSQEVVEMLNTTRKLKLNMDLFLEVLSVGSVNPPDITYKYTISRDAAPKYSWQLYNKEWSKCSSICSGMQSTQPSCVELHTGTHVDEALCTKASMKGSWKSRACNTHCKLTWKEVSRGHCSSHCGVGHQRVHYRCFKVPTEYGSFEDVPRTEEFVDEKHCSVLPKPGEFESCVGPCTFTKWAYDDWTECTKSCGGGLQTRSAICVDINSNQIDESHCDKNAKNIEQLCNNRECPTWEFAEWSPCSVTCGKGYQEAAIYCTLDGQILPSVMCGDKERPNTKRECSMRPCVHWRAKEWVCSVTCGEGIESRDVFCQSTDRKRVPDMECYDLLKPNSSRMCRLPKCLDYNPYIKNNDVYDNALVPSFFRGNAVWRSTAWGECSKPCNGGERYRKVECQNHKSDLLPDNRCIPQERPVDVAPCNPHPCPKWVQGEWSACDSNCQRRRLVSCRNAGGASVDDSQCPQGGRPANVGKCALARCSYNRNVVERKIMWKPGRWGPCSNACGKGRRLRNVSCVDVANSVPVDDQYCQHLEKPPYVKNCQRTKKSCNFMWVEGRWSVCSKSCGEGVMHRDVSCHRVVPGGFPAPIPIPLPNSLQIDSKTYCDPHTKPSTSSPCKLKDCRDEYSWVAGNWKPCSHDCGKKGRQIRNLFCHHRDGKKVQKHLCPKAYKPQRKRKCNQVKCSFTSCKDLQKLLHTTRNGDYNLSINKKNATVYCHRMETANPEEFISLEDYQENYAEIYDKRLLNISACPFNGLRKDNCDCIHVESERSGLTVFWKVRLNLSTMSIIGDDFTFSRQVKEARRIPYGTAGDCYSTASCPQGRFSIDLSGTSFKLSPNVRWINLGPNANSQINKKERVASGKCGGYCGNCEPDPDYGLAVEVT